MAEIHGDFLLQGVGNDDAKIGGYAAPWYSRYGHSLDALDGDGDGVADVMVLAGGNSPIPSNVSIMAMLLSLADAIIYY